MSNITRSTPYLAPGAPKSPIVLATAGLLVLLASAVASRLGFTIATDGDTIVGVASALVTIVGLVQHRMARGEQADGAPKLAAAVVAALAEPPPSPEGVPDAMARVLARANRLVKGKRVRGIPVVSTRSHPEDAADAKVRIVTHPWCCEPGCKATPIWWQGSNGVDHYSVWCTAHLPRAAKGELRYPLVGADPGPTTGNEPPEIDAAAQLHALDPSKRMGLDPWAGMALREILKGEQEGSAGPIEWSSAAGGLRVVIDGYSRWAAPDDPRSVAAAVGAERWLEADGSVPAPRPRVPSSALLDDEGTPISAGDLDSGEIEEDTDPDERTTERVVGDGE